MCSCFEGLQSQWPASCLSLNYWGPRTLPVPDHLGQATFSLACHSADPTRVHPTCTITYKCPLEGHDQVSSVTQVTPFPCQRLDFSYQTRVYRVRTFHWLRKHLTQIKEFTGRSQAEKITQAHSWMEQGLIVLDSPRQPPSKMSEVCVAVTVACGRHRLCVSVTGLGRCKWRPSETVSREDRALLKALGSGHDRWNWRKKGRATKEFFITIPWILF